MQNPLRMTVKIGHFGARRILPETQLIIAETVRTKYFSLFFIPNQGANLTVCGDCIDKFSGFDIPESHSLV